jgi:hypothetical protein
MDCPPISKSLADYLQARFPNKLPETTVDTGQLGQLIGQQQVILHLLANYQRQNKTVLSPT